MLYGKFHICTWYLVPVLGILSAGIYTNSSYAPLPLLSLSLISISI